MRTWLGVVSLAVLLLLAPGIRDSSESESEPFWFGVIIHRNSGIRSWATSQSEAGCPFT
jgi:hypothetical protein